ncbi:helicase HerA domain-containing protein [Elusimicrobiota bacterium]
MPPTRGSAAGEHPIGQIVYNNKDLYPLALREIDFIKQIGIFSITGAGKTNLGMLLALQLLKKKTPWLILDWKRQYRSLLSLDPEKYPKVENIQVYTIGRTTSPLKFNPFRGPPNVDKKTWISIIAEILERSHLSGPGVADLFLKIYDQVLADTESDDDEQGMQPNFFDGLRELAMIKAAGREFLWKQSCGRILRSFTYGPLAGAFNARHPAKLEELLEKPVILELDMELPQWMRTFITELILRFIHLYRLSEGETAGLRHVLFLEEVHNLFPRTWPQKGTSNLEGVFREIRTFGQGLVSITQHTSLLPIYILGNCQTQVTLALQHGDDIDASKKSLFLERGQEVYLDRTRVGEGIVKIKGRVNPCLVRFPLVPTKIGAVSDGALAQHMGGCLADLRRNNSKSKVVTVISPPDNTLTESQERLLLDVLQFPLCGVLTRYRNLGMNPRQGSSDKGRLVSKGFVTPVDISTGKGRVLLLDLTQKGRAHLQGIGHQTAAIQESLEHRFWKGRVAHYYRQEGYNVDVEKFINGRPDLIVKRGEASAAVEIETGKSSIISNVLRNLGAGFSSIIIVATSQAAHRSIANTLSAAGLTQNNTIQLVPAKNF